MDKSKNIIDIKIEEVQAILHYLEKRFGLDFFLSIFKNSKKQKINKTISSETKSNEFLEILKAEVENKKLVSHTICNLLQQGYNIVQCVDINDLDTGIGLELNQFYSVSEIVIIPAGDLDSKDFNTFYKLRRPDGSTSHYLFNIRRFLKMTLVENSQ